MQQTWLSTNLSNGASTTASTDTRRMSEPCHTITDRKSPPPRPASVTLSPLKGNLTTSEHHPNQAVVLDEVEEGEMVENKLVIPDEMVRYLNQVVDNQTDELGSLNWPEMDSNQMVQSPGTFSQTNIMSPASTVHPVLPSPSNINAFVPSPSNHLNPMLQSPAQPNFNQVVPSPSNNMNQMMHSPSQPPPLHPIMSSPGRNTTQNDNMNQMPSPSMVNLNTIMPSPSSNMNQMIPSPAANMNAMIHSPAPSMLPSPVCNQMAQVIPSPSSNYQVMPSPSSTYGDMANTMTQPSMSHISMMPATNNMNRMPSRCSSQIMQMNNQNQGNCNPNNMMPNGQIMVQNNQVVPNCYNRPMNHGCYNMQHWDGNNCQSNISVQQGQHNNICNNNADYNNPCRPQVPMMSPGYNVPQQMQNPSNQCTNHTYQHCNQNNFNHCQNKPIGNFNCNNQYQVMQNQTYNCRPNINEPLPSPAMATPAPTEIMGQPQQAQMSRPCSHYMQHNMQNCFQPQPPQYPMQQQQQQNTGPCSNCANCQKQGYFIQNVNNDLKPKMVSQPQPSPGNIANETTLLGMRQDTYQRTLEYVQNCQSWVNNSETTNSTMSFAKCGDKPSSNMIVNDMTSSLSSLLEENRYLQMIQ